MPARFVMGKFRRHTLRSGSKHGPTVRNPKQAKAILLSEARDEGYDIPEAARSGRRKRLGRGRGRS